MWCRLYYPRIGAAALRAPAALQRVDAETWSHQIRKTEREEFQSLRPEKQIRCHPAESSCVGKIFSFCGGATGQFCLCLYYFYDKQEVGSIMQKIRLQTYTHIVCLCLCFCLCVRVCPGADDITLTVPAAGELW